MDSNSTNNQLETANNSTIETTISSNAVNEQIGDNNCNITTTTTTTTLQQTNVNVPPKKLTPEQEEELKLRAKYPNQQKPGGSQFIQKMLHKGNKKYFDSGDYNMAKSKNKLPSNLQQTPSPTQITTTSTPNTSLTPQSTLSTTTTTTATATTLQQTNLTTTTINQSTLQQTPSTPGSNKILPSLQSSNQLQPQLNINDSSLLSTSSSTTSTNTHTNTPLSAYSSPVVNLNHHHQQQDLQTDNQNLYLINDDIIGHEIPTPECLSTRKHSVVQSKLATTTN